MEPGCGDFERKLLGAVERCVPLVREPYARMAAELGCSEKSLLDHLKILRAANGVIREISGVFYAPALGYSQALVALGVEAQKADAAGRTVAEHPGVSHCYKRSGTYSIWFTLAVSSRSSLGLQNTALALADACGAGSHMILPALKRYKLSARFAAEDHSGPRPETPTPRSAELSDEQMLAGRALQMDLPNASDPFAIVAEKAGIGADDLLVHASDFLSAGWMRRYAAALHHRAAGARENVLVAWAVGPEQADRAGAACAKPRQVSHCYLRPPGPDWPHTLYTMIHGRDRAECERVITELAGSAGLAERQELWTLAEFKKRRVPLFGDEETKWEAAHG